MEEMNQVIYSVIEKFTSNNTTCQYDLKNFVVTIGNELDKIFMRKFAKRVQYFHGELTSSVPDNTSAIKYYGNSYYLLIKNVGENLLPEGNWLIAIEIQEDVSHGKKCNVIINPTEYYKSEKGFSFTCQRAYHPAVAELAELMQKKLNMRREKYSTQTWDTWRELNRVALLKHFDEECLEFKSELYKFINDPEAIPNAEEKEAMMEELADVANIGFMIVQRILGGNTTVIPDDVEHIVCNKCGKSVKAQLAIKGTCYTCKKLELH